MMRIEDGVAIMAAAVVLAVLSAALVPRDFFQEHLADLPAGLAMNLPPQGSTWQDGGGAQMVPAASPASPARTKVKPGYVRLEQAPVVRFAGVIQQLSELPEQDGQIHIWLENTDGQELRISVAPAWFLEYIGCQPFHDMTIAGLGFQFDATGPEPLVYARKIKMGDKTCQLRNDEGFALWSNRLR